MAELVVKAEYDNATRNFVLFMLKAGFPVWGIIAPIGFAICLVFLLGTFTSNWSVTVAQLNLTIGLMLGFLALPSFGLLATHWLQDKYLLVDKTGLTLPPTIGQVGRFNRHLGWNSINKIQIFGSHDNWAKRKLCIFLNKGPAVKLKLSNMQPAQVEQILLAFDMWGQDCEKDSSIRQLQDFLKNEVTAGADRSYTDMWEEELRRRFCPTAFMPLEPGRILKGGALKVVRHLALGGLSAVYLCQLNEKKLVVLKEAVVPEDSPEHMQEKAREMFEREANLLIKLKHQGIVGVLDYFVEGGRNYLMLEYINGQDIRQYVKQNGPQKEHVVLDWAMQIARILKYLHEQDPPIVHRDLTPDNLVLRDDGTIVVIDFGAANEFLGNATGTFVGKQSFIAPEQFRGKAVVQSDIYALGCTLYFLLVGEDPEALSTSSPRQANEEISRDLDDIVICCTEMEPEDRYQSAAQLIPVLQKASATLTGV